MRTTLTIDDDVLAAARGLALRERRNIGDVISDLSRRSLASSGVPLPAVRNGVPLIPRLSNATPITPEIINQLRDETS